MIVLCCFIPVSLSAMHANMPSAEDVVGIKYRLTEGQRYGVIAGFLGLHLAYNAMAAYFQTMQMTTLPKMTHSLSDIEDGVKLEDLRCGKMCRDNSNRYRDYAEDVMNLDMVSTMATVASASCDIIALSLLAAYAAGHSEYKANIEKFTNIALGASVVNGILNLASTALLAKLGTSYRDGISIVTIGKLQIALSAGLGYMAPSFPFVVLGVVKVGRAFYDKVWSNN